MSNFIFTEPNGHMYKCLAKLKELRATPIEHVQQRIQLTEQCLDELIQDYIQTFRDVHI
jgi:hypothetical protein